MAQQTAVKFLFEKMKNDHFNFTLDYQNQLIDLFKTAAKMEKQQIIEAFDNDGYEEGEEWITNGEQYYRRTYMD